MIRRLMRIWAGSPARIRALGARYAVAAVLQGVLLAMLVPLLRALLVPQPDLAGVLRWLGAMAVVGAGYAVVMWRARAVGYRLAGVIMGDLQRDLGRHLARLPLGWFTGNRPGTVARVVAQSTFSAAGAVSHLWPNLLSSVLTPATVAALVFLVDWRMALALLVTVPLALAVLRWTGPVVRNTQEVMDAASAEAAGRAIEFAQAQPVLRSTGRAHAGYPRMEHALDEQRRTFRTALTRHTMPQFAFQGVVQLGFTLALVTGAGLALSGGLALPDAVALLVLTSRFVEPLALISGTFGGLRSADVAIDQVAAILRAPILPEPAGPVHPRGGDIGGGGDIELDRVRFGYGDRQVLHEVTLRVPAGTTTALVGPSGSGKTTIIRLVARFWDVGSGAVRVGGLDVRDVAHHELMSRVALVFQDVYLFDGTIEDNLRLARPDASPAQLHAAAAAARLDDVLQRLPDGWASRVGEGGAALSGGERQRVAIARALLKDAPIVLLDEATSALDPENEQAVAQALAALTTDARRTVLVVAHRLSTVVRADHIVVLDRGRVVETGTHRTLLADDGRYAALWAQRTRSRRWQIAP